MSFVSKLGVLALSSAVLLTSCGATKQARSVDTSGFLGDYSNFTEGTGDQALLRWEKPDLSLKGYTRLIIDPVEIWMTEADADEAKAREALASFLRSTVAEKLRQEFEIVSTPGPGTARLRMAITEADGSPPVRNTLTTIVPFGRAFSILKEVATGRGVGVGAASLEVELQDSSTNERLIAAVDRRFGRKNVVGMIDKWSDAEAAYEHWAGTMLERAREMKKR